MKTKTIETFRDVGAYELDRLNQGEPSCFNGVVRVERYRMTLEKIEEPVEVIQARLRKLWAECDNHHHREPLIRTGMKFGIDLRVKGA